MLLSRAVCAGVLGLLALGADPLARAAQAQEVTVSSSCVLKNDLYTCDKAKFDQIFGPAKTAAIETAPTDAVAKDQLRKLVAASGKTLVGTNEHPDITFLLVPTDQSGVQYTSNRSALGVLRVFAARPDQAGRGQMVWAENFTGEGDTPWLLVVTRLTSQFKSRFHQ